MEKDPNIYEAGHVAEEERKRLQSLEYPVAISEEVLGKDIEGKTVLDLGSGPNTALSKFAQDHGAHYVAFDINQRFLEEQKKEGSEVVRGDIKLLPFQKESVDIIHVRFVLMHLDFAERKLAIQEAMRAAGQKVEFLEYDWGTVQGGELVGRFRDFAMDFMRGRGIEPLMGQKLREEIKGVVSSDDLLVTERRFHRDAGSYYDEILPLAKSIREIAIQMKDESLAQNAEGFIVELENELQKEKPEPFTRPDIVVVEVLREE